MTRMLGAVRPSWCPRCKGPAGEDCPDVGTTPRQQKRIEARQVARNIEGESQEGDER